MAIWDTSESKKIENHFESFLITDSYNKKDYKSKSKNVMADEAEDDFEDMDGVEEDDEEESVKKDKKDKKKKKKKDKKEKSTAEAQKI